MEGDAKDSCLPAGTARRSGGTQRILSVPFAPLRILCVTLLLASCASKEEHGQQLFDQNCASCHNFRNDGIGPRLSGVTEKLSDDSIRSLLEKPRGNMPSFAHLKDDEVSAIIAFLTTKPAPPKQEFKPDGTEITDPIPEKIAMSDLVIDLKEVTTIPASSNEGQKTRICKLDYRPDTKDVFVVDLRGKLYQLASDGPKVYLDIAKEKPNFIHTPGLATGFGSFAFHPDFARNNLLYTTHTESPGSGLADFAYADTIKVTLQWVLSEWNMKTMQNRELWRANMVHQIHGVQEITFNPLSKPGDEDYGLLYIGVGDGGAVEMGYPELAHGKDKFWGSIVRVNPQGNTEIFAYGFRNPHRISWSKKGQMLSANIGHGNIEALNIIEKGRDYGWPEREGTFVMRYREDMKYVYPLPANDSIYHYTYPVAQYDHDEGKAIAGGLEYWGTKLNALKGKYVFGDIVNGRLFFVEMDDLAIGKQAPIKELQLTLNGQKTTLVQTTGDEKVDVRFGRDHAGEMYILTKPDGKVYKVVGASHMAL